MRSRLYRRLRRITSSLMLLAMAAFVQQDAMIAVSQAAAFSGSFPQPAVTLSGAIHLHDNLAGHVHVHGHHNKAGHVHHTADFDHPDSDQIANPPLCSLGCPSIVIPIVGGCAPLFDVVSAGERPPHDRLEGIEPEGLNRPPSTPGIA